jgi:ATP-binding cassette subfamily B protein
LILENKKLWLRILKCFKPYIKQILIILFIMLLSTITSLLSPLINKHLMDDGLLAGSWTNVIKYSLVSFIIILLGQGVSFLETKYEARLSTLFPYDMSIMAFKKNLKLKMEYLNNTNYSETLNNLNMDIGNISSLLSRSSFFIADQVFKIIGGSIGLIMIDWKLALAIITIVPIRYFTVKKLVKKKESVFEKYMNYSSAYASWYGDTMQGVKEIKLLTIEHKKIEEFIEKQKPILNSNIEMFIRDKTYIISEELTIFFVQSLIYIMGSLMTIRGEITIGGLLAFITYSLYVTSPISSIIGLGYSYSNVLQSSKRFFEFMDMDCEENPSNGNKIRLDDTFKIEKIEYKNVSFSYKNGKELLKNICIEIQHGEKIAIVGMNGSGKTTLINLLLRLYSPDEGEIYINNTNIEDICLSDYRNLISTVGQDFYLFNKTILENINIRGSASEEEIYKAARLSGIYEFLNKQNKRFGSKIGRNGTNLSGGERQKLALARALLHNSQILFLDEITSNVDNESEIRINQIIKSINDKTILVISHRTEVLRWMDRIIVMDNGTISEICTFEKLCENGILSQLNNMEN